MHFSFRRRALVALLCAVTGCSGVVSDQPGVRVISGKLELSQYSLDNPVVIAHSVDDRKFLGTVARDGSFSLKVPAGGTYQLLVANQTRTEQLAVLTRISWPTLQPTNWIKVAAGAPISLGVVQPLAAEACPANPDETTNPVPGAGSTQPPSTSVPPTGTSTPAGTETPTTPETSAPTCQATGDADLPYDARIGVGMEYQLSWSFLEKGPLPKQIVSVTMEGGGTWRLAELQADTRFVVTQADCDHVGNRDVGRDRIEVTWVNQDGSRSTDHLDLRYCDGNSGLKFSGATPSQTTSSTEVCTPREVQNERESSGICGNVGRADLPYDARIGVGMEYKLSWSFLEKGPLPAKILSVGMEAGGSWRLAELQADTTFVVTQADCDHVGNRDVGRDRIEVTWQNQDGSTSTDHLDMRYCDGNSGLKFRNGGVAAAATTSTTCEKPTVTICANGEVPNSRTNVTGITGVTEATGAEGTASAEASVESHCQAAPPLLPPLTEAPPNAPCVVSADCGSDRACFGSTCVMQCVTQCGATTCTSAP
jgi:hypothetical protein